MRFQLTPLIGSRQVRNNVGELATGFGPVEPLQPGVVLRQGQPALGNGTAESVRNRLAVGIANSDVCVGCAGRGAVVRRLGKREVLMTVHGATPFAITVLWAFITLLWIDGKGLQRC